MRVVFYYCSSTNVVELIHFVRSLFSEAWHTDLPPWYLLLIRKIFSLLVMCIFEIVSIIFYLYVIFPNDKFSYVIFLNNDFGGFLSLFCLFTSPTCPSPWHAFSSSIYPYIVFFTPANISPEVSFHLSWGPFSHFFAFIDVYAHTDTDTLTEDRTYMWRECTV